MSSRKLIFEDLIERAGILEYDAKMDRAVASQKAKEMVCANHNISVNVLNTIIKEHKT